MAWRVVLYCGLVWHEVSFCGLVVLWLCMACRAMKWCGFAVAWLDVLFCGLAWFGLACCYGVNAGRIGVACHEVAWLGMLCSSACCCAVALLGVLFYGLT